MADRRYLTETPPSPSALRRGINQGVLPRMIDAAALVEALIERAAMVVRRAPGTTLCAALGLGLLAGRRR